MSDPHFRFRGPARLVRGGVLAGAVALASAAAHTAGGGSVASATDLLPLLPVAFVLCTSVADRRRTAAWIFGYCLAVQALFHVLLLILGGHQAHSSALLPSPPMVAGHICAAAGIAVVLAYGDDLAHRWMVFLASLTRPLPSVGKPVEWTHVTVHGATRGFPVAAERWSSASRRGPPRP